MDWKKDAIKWSLILAGIVLVLFILYYILNSVSVCMGCGSGDPSSEAGKTVKAIMRDNSRLGSSNEVTFKKGTTINNRNISGETGGVIQSNEVCISAGDFSSDLDWKVNETNTLLQYIGDNPDPIMEFFGINQSVKAKIIATCDSPAFINSTYSNASYYFTSEFEGQINPDWFSNCGCLTDPKANRCCFVAVKRYN